MRILWRSIAVALVALLVGAPAALAAGGTRTYTARQTIPVAPASTFQGSGGGDGWAVALTPTRVLNVHHHNGQVTLACRKQVDASLCWSAPTKTATDPSGADFGTWHPGLELVQATNRLYVFAVRMTDGIGGVLCLDAAVADATPNPYCGFTPLTGAGESIYQNISNGVTVGSRFFAFNQSSDGATTGARNKVLCFDLNSGAACPSQPFIVNFTGSPHSQVSPIAAVSGRVLIPVLGTGGVSCFDTGTNSSCVGAWPVASNEWVGAPFPLLDTSGAAVGACTPTGSGPCFKFDGSSATPPAGLTSAIGQTQYWNGPALTIGSRVYVPDGTTDSIQCYDFGTSAQCPNFPHALPNSSYMYTVNADPQRPTCLWTNADHGSAQIQNFDAYSGLGCGEGPIRVLAKGFLPPSPDCVPVDYSKLQIIDPARTSYSDGSVAFRDSSGAALPGVPDQAIDSTGSVDLTGLDLNQNGLPQFLVTLNNPANAASKVTLEMTWVGPNTADCGGTVNTVVTAKPGVARVLPGAQIYFPSLSATLTDVSGKRLSGQLVQFRSGSTPLCSATTDSNGVAQCSATLTAAPFVIVNLGYDAVFAGSEGYAPSTTHAPALVVGGTPLR